MNITHTYHISCFDLEQIARSGQCFRMTLQTDGSYRVISRGRILTVRQEGTSLFLLCPEEELSFWVSYFDLERDYQAILDSVDPEDEYLKAAARTGKGIRILRQDPWEMIITFVISQQKTIPKIRELVEELCRGYGTPLETPEHSVLYAFPSPAQLSAASLEDLLALKLGYRAKYIHQLCRDALEGKLEPEKLHSMTYDEAMAYLTGFYGIGKKVANCICLFGLHHIDAFPVDTWIEKILTDHYFDEKKYRHTPKTHLYEQIIKDHFGRYDGFSGVIQQYIFYYERTVINGR